MSLEKIKKLTQIVRKQQGTFTFVEDEITDLLIAISEFVTRPDKCEKQNEVLKNLVRPKEFEEKYQFVARSTLHNWCLYNKEFVESCAEKIGNKWYIDEIKTLAYCTAQKAFKKKMERSFFKEKISASNNKI